MKNPYPINPLLRLLVRAWIRRLSKTHNITANISDRIKYINEPYLLISNHVGRYDPFIVSYFIIKPPNFISSDAILRDRIIGTAFKKLGAMPKKKGVRDSYIIREMVKVVEANGALALFPEGARTWSGKTLDFDPSLAKLVKLLNIPVITVKMKGAYAYDPRWAKSIRKARVEVDYEYVFEKGETRKMSEDEIYNRIASNLIHDDIDYAQKNSIRIDSDHRAEYIERILYFCPDCDKQSYFKSKGNTFSCTNCGTETFVNEYGFFDREKMTNTRDWVDWQNAKWVKELESLIPKISTDEPILTSREMTVSRALGRGSINKIGTGTLNLYLDRIEFSAGSERFKFTIKEVADLSPQFNERLEVTVGDVAYRFESMDEIEPGMRWEIAINMLWKHHDLLTYLSPFFKNLVMETDNTLINKTKDS